MSVATPTRQPETGRCAGLCTDEGFAAAYREHAPRLQRTARAVLGDTGLAEDAVQEAFLRAWRACATFDPSTGPPVIGWLVTITRNVAIDQLRAKGLRPGPVGHLDNAAATTAGPMDGVVLRAVLGDALAQVSERHRAVLVRAVVHDRAHAEVAAEIGVPVGTVKSRLHHGLRGMRRLLDPPGPA